MNEEQINALNRLIKARIELALMDAKVSNASTLQRACWITQVREAEEILTGAQ